MMMPLSVDNRKYPLSYTSQYLSCVLRNPTFLSCENKCTDQQRNNSDLHLCFRYRDSSIPLLAKSKIISLLPYSPVLSDLVGNQDRFSHNEAHLSCLQESNTLLFRAINFRHATVANMANAFGALSV